MGAKNIYVEMRERMLLTLPFLTLVKFGINDKSFWKKWFKLFSKINKPRKHQPNRYLKCNEEFNKHLSDLGFPEIDKYFFYQKLICDTKFDTDVINLLSDLGINIKQYFVLK